MILLIAGGDDVHSLAVRGKIVGLGEEAILVNYELMPTAMSIGFSGGGNRHEVVINLGGMAIPLSGVRSVLYRRPKRPQADYIKHPGLRDYVVSECQLMIDTLASTSSAKWVSDPDKVGIASRKPIQLIEAAEVGFMVPRSYVGNDTKMALQFIEELSNCEAIAIKSLHKPFIDFNENQRPRYAFTQRIPKNRVKLIDLERIKNCPVIIQEYIEKKFELRVTVVGQKIFACAIHSQLSDRTKVDWRRYDISNTPHHAYELPEKISHCCLSLVERLGLQFGAIDMIVTPDDDYVFIEINPVGQWLWIETLTGLPITSSLAELLTMG